MRIRAAGSRCSPSRISCGVMRTANSKLARGSNVRTIQPRPSRPTFRKSCRRAARKKIARLGSSRRRRRSTHWVGRRPASRRVVPSCAQMRERVHELTVGRTRSPPTQFHRQVGVPCCCRRRIDFQQLQHNRRYCSPAQGPKRRARSRPPTRFCCAVRPRFCKIALSHTIRRPPPGALSKIAPRSPLPLPSAPPPAPSDLPRPLLPALEKPTRTG